MYMYCMLRYIDTDIVFGTTYTCTVHVVRSIAHACMRARARGGGGAARFKSAAHPWQNSAGTVTAAHCKPRERAERLLLLVI